jgi:asparagine synthase (glutamine-hydrolysing)
MIEVNSLFLGRCDFDGAHWAEQARKQGPAAVWHEALAGGLASAKSIASAARGEFAVGLRDARGRAFLAVDRFAAQTLCYTLRDGKLLFAARADELANDADLDPQALFDYLYFHVIPSPRTVWRGVHRLPPGHLAWFGDGQLTVVPYWTPRFAEPPAPSFDALAETFRAHLKSAVARQLDGSKPACFLSGGTDSSTVAGMIGAGVGRPAATYSIGFEAEGYDEMAYARIAAQRFETEHHEYYVTPADLVRSMPAVAAHHDQPFGNSSALPAYYCALKARDDGVTRLLAGDGGDELFGGNTRYAKQRVFGLYGQLPQALRRGVMEPIFGHGIVTRTPGLKKGSSYIEQARVPMPDRLQMYNLLLRLGLDDVLAPAFLARVDRDDPARQQRTVWAQSDASTSDINRMLAYDWRYTLAESDLPKVRSSTQLAGVEVGYPFLDPALVDFSLGLPSHYKLRGLKLRWFFKEALRGFLPDAILMKKKQGFGLPFGVWANRHAALHDLATDALDGLAQRGVVKPTFLRTLLATHLPAHPGYYGEMVWILTMLELWLRHHAPAWRID